MNALETQTWSGIQQQLKGFVLRQTRDKALTEDIVHDVFLKIHNKLPQLRENDKIIAWIYRIARNTITDHFRMQAKAIRAVDLDWESASPTLNDCVIACLQEMLLTLPDKYREAIELAELKNMSQLQLAETLQISYSGAKSRVQRARQLLKEKMEQTYRIKFDNYGNVVVCENRLPCGCSQS
ncbi:sigma-70 family RNA polymerase sigma factor [Fulvivirgaceae bacterium PWU4]|uniref:Sigma-70 family RNA polymerase sigma factor n=1 Tax=Chryseosolibacter histidini TaxID=2782349 RepID=A0AAP2GM00_9BACT|nr:sigma-70 family RNA polymerase sigma factor [Chryseosolibacter histidini]MBT1700971.1 sigma-70 family RNA polymerase sigma factor [Chryseosolibacter histidini]